MMPPPLARDATTARGPEFAYFDALGCALERARSANGGSLEAASAIVADVVAAEGIVYVFGSGHSQLAALELRGRAGVIAPLQVIVDPRWGAAEHLEGYAETLLGDVTFEARDLLVAISNSGVTAAPIEIVERARSAGARIVAVTSVGASSAAAARHSTGRRLFELADVVLDTGAPPNDAGVSLTGLGEPIGPLSTLLAAALLHQVVVGAVARLAAARFEPPVFRANSATGGREHNDALRARYRGRIGWVP